MPVAVKHFNIFILSFSVQFLLLCRLRPHRRFLWRRRVHQHPWHLVRQHTLSTFFLDSFFEIRLQFIKLSLIFLCKFLVTICTNLSCYHFFFVISVTLDPFFRLFYLSSSNLDIGSLQNTFGPSFCSLSKHQVIELVEDLNLISKWILTEWKLWAHSSSMISGSNFGSPSESRTSSCRFEFADSKSLFANSGLRLARTV